jgi:hypothetical protein
MNHLQVLLWNEVTEMLEMSLSHAEDFDKILNYLKTREINHPSTASNLNNRTSILFHDYMHESGSLKWKLVTVWI